MQASVPLLSVENLKTWFGAGDQPVRAVDGVTFSVHEAETVALVGESGCGKSVTALSLARLVHESSGLCTGGRVVFGGEDVLRMSRHRLTELRGRDIAYVFQEPGTALNPVLRVGYQIMEAVRVHGRDVDARQETIELMRMVGLPDPVRRLRAYPHEMSGGMQQRVMVAMALAGRPRLLVADEPTTALDVTIQAQILELLASLQRQLGMAVLLITHNLGLVADVAHSVNVMYAGRIVESGPAEELLGRPAHPYTVALLAAVPDVEAVRGHMIGIAGTVPHPARLPQGCKFAPRCTAARAICREREPVDTVMTPERRVRCHFARDVG